MVVLSVGLTPPVAVKGLAKKLGIELNHHDFCKLNPFNPIDQRDRNFVSGAFTGYIESTSSFRQRSKFANW